MTSPKKGRRIAGHVAGAAAVIAISAAPIYVGHDNPSEPVKAVGSSVSSGSGWIGGAADESGKGWWGKQPTAGHRVKNRLERDMEAAKIKQQQDAKAEIEASGYVVQARTAMHDAKTPDDVHNVAFGTACNIHRKYFGDNASIPDYNTHGGRVVYKYMEGTQPYLISELNLRLGGDGAVRFEIEKFMDISTNNKSMCP